MLNFLQLFFAMKSEAFSFRSTYRVSIIFILLHFFPFSGVECAPGATPRYSADEQKGFPSSSRAKADDFKAEASASVHRTVTPSTDIFPRLTNSTRGPSESVEDISEVTTKMSETSRPRHSRSTVQERVNKVFMDSSFTDYSLSWITKDSFRAQKGTEHSEDATGDEDTSADPTYFWTPHFSGYTSGLPSAGHGNLMMAVPTKTTSKRTIHCCQQGAALGGFLPGSGGEDSRSAVLRSQGVSAETADRKNVLYIGGIFELTKNSLSESARSELDAALLAIRHVNQNRVVPGYRLQLVYNDSKCDAGVGTDVFYDMIYRMGTGRHITMVMGSACTEVTKTLAEIVPYWNLILISYAATSPALGDREKYRTFFRLALADSSLVPARRMFINSMGWKTVAVIYEDIEKYSLAMNAIAEDFAMNNITIAASLSFKDAAAESPEKLRKLKNRDLRIILAAFSVATARQVFCEAYRQGLFGPRYVWLLMGGFQADSWWKDPRGTDCTAQQLTSVVDGCFAVVSLNTLLGGRKSVANLTTTEFEEAYYASNGSVPMSFFAATTYDTVWTIALTMSEAISRWRQSKQPVPPLHEMNYSAMASVRDTYIDIIENSHFNGVSGPVSFKGSDREGVSVIYQLQGDNFSRVAIHYPDSPQLDFHCDGCRPIVWQGGRIPRDMKIMVPREKTITAAIFYISAAFCGAGILLALVFLQYNLYHRKLKYIKLSSPKLNNVAVIGCILVYATVILMGLDDRIMPPDVFSVVCTVRVFLLAAGFSLAFGAMFAKTFRVHQIFTRAHHGLVKNKLLRDRHLLFLIGGLLVLDSGVVCVWVIVDPMQRHVTNLTMESSEEDEDLIFLTQLATCHSEHLQKWMGSFYAYKGLLLLFGVYMAWETRNVKIPALNDSQYIGFNVYNVVLMSMCVVVLSNILSSQPTLSYAIESAFMVLSTTVTLCLLFVPKIYVIVTSGGDPVIASTGILVEANTRRFVVDEKKEIYYRAEVQNRVYKRELVELDQEINRLERLLELPMEDYPKLSEELLFLLPDPKVGGTSTFGCNQQELDRCSSISDGGEGVSYGKEETEEMLREMGEFHHSQQETDDVKSRLNTHPPFGKRGSTQENVPKAAFKKLRRLSRSLSIGHSSHLKWKMRASVKSGISGKSDNRLWTGVYSRSRESVTADSDDLSLSLSSLPLSPADFEKDADKSRFAALLKEELACSNSDLILGNGGISLLGEEECHTRAGSWSTSSDNETVPTIDKITQTNFADNPLNVKTRFGQVYHVDRLEVIELDENPHRTGSRTSSSSLCQVVLNNQVHPTSPNDGTRSVLERSVVEDASHSHGACSGDLLLRQSVKVEEKVSNLLRPYSFPEKLSSYSTGSISPSVRSPCARRGIAVHFSPYNEVRFVDKTESSDSFFVDEANSSESFFTQEAAKSPSTAAHPNLPSAHLQRNLACSVSNEPSSSNHSEILLDVRTDSTERTKPGSDKSVSGETSSSLASNPVRPSLRCAQSLVEKERRKRIRKLQHDLQCIQRELQDLDDLEYDVTEV